MCVLYPVGTARAQTPAGAQTPAAPQKERDVWIRTDLPVPYTPTAAIRMPRMDDWIREDLPFVPTPIIAKREPGKLLGVKIPRVNPTLRMERDVVNYLFVPQKMWTVGVDFSYLSADMDNYEFTFVKNWKGNAHTSAFSPFFCYFFRDNTGVGGRFVYQRTTLRVDKLDFDLGDDFNFDLKDLYFREEMYTGAAFIRTYVGLGKNKRFGLFNDAVLSFGAGNGRLYSGRNAPDVIKDTHQTIREWKLGIKPGLSAFITNQISMEASVDLIGMRFRRVEQFENGRSVGIRKAAKLNFKADIFSLYLGISIYI